MSDSTPYIDEYNHDHLVDEALMLRQRIAELEARHTALLERLENVPDYMRPAYLENIIKEARDEQEA